MSVKIPKRFQNKLLPSVLSLIYNNPLDNGNGIVNYLETSPYYFDEYTIHGARHITAVLNYADKLIPQSDYEKMSELDISVLVLGILLHDLGMFIKESGLKYLLQLETKNVYDNNGINCTWKELWDGFIKKLKHSSGNELDEIFGDKEHIFDLSSRQVCATFIRKYHHLIAYHIAIHGFPGKANHKLLNGISEDCARLIGLLAKSHGMALRDLNEEVDDFGYDNNLPLNVPIYYLMSILRLADLLDADESRAPKILSDMNDFSSLRSANEWTLNQLIKGRQWVEDTGKPDTLKMIATPTNSKQFLELKSWFDYWQKELDLSWAIIGETHNDKFKLSIRRITSNIFSTQYDFITTPIELKVNPDIVKLLVAPLYGDDPSYGVRELLQNAIDACNERTAIDGTVGEIIIDVNKETGTFTITDNGIGMNEEVIANYYLTAGASYRYNRQWTETFLDSENDPKIARSGRFGIGALATFLIGGKAKVITRHIKDDKGYCFEYTIEPKILNVNKVDKNTPGTTIEISMNKKAIEEFTRPYWHPWAEWYHFTTPNIIYKLNGKELKKEKTYNLRKDEDLDGWFACESSDYYSFHWTTAHYVNGDFLCNGIHIPNHRDYYGDSPIMRSLKKCGYYHNEPTISVIDKNGIFPLDLARKSVFDTFLLDDNVTAELCKYQIAKFLVNGYNNHCIFNKRGFIPRERAFILNVEQPIYLIGKAAASYEIITNFKQYDVAIGYFTANKKIYANNIKDEVVGDILMCSSTITEIWANNSVIDIPKTVDYLPRKNKIHSIDNTIDWQSNLEIPQEVIGGNVNLIVKYIPSTIKKDENNIMFKVIEEFLPSHINGGWIPFNEKEREKLYSDTYKKLERYIKWLKSEKERKSKETKS